MRIALTGGGTGGHAAPALAVAEALRRLDPDVEILYIGSRGGMEEALARDAKLDYRGITARKIRSATPIAMAGVAVALVRGLAEAFLELRAFGPDALLGTGGYAAASAVRAAAALGTPCAIHEQNVVPGRTNLWLARSCKEVYISTPAGLSNWPPGSVTLTGLPLRSVVLEEHAPEAARRALGLDPARPVLLILGGSQGALSLNAGVFEALPLLPEALQVVHQTGARGIAEARTVAASLGDRNYQCVEFMPPDRLALAYSAADLALCRCGASTLAECHAHGLPTLMTPLPSAYADHQTHNAGEAEGAGAGILLPQSEMSGQRLAREVTGLMQNPSTLEAMGVAARRMGAPGAADRVAELLAGLATKGR